ncbi:PorT family protein [Flavobacterium sp. MFBS3-15]|uniref:porin family protein n=1 Tax=Flavobacterium sp. MFBS3-15 TaxID=2989816 RepID=UPI002235C3AA|nr:porin family protein [Flavobacterium sp. MFBS3-15]MCW4467442.1 PorT family protein [Flavobacterium sp. MFBS3-15]
MKKNLLTVAATLLAAASFAQEKMEDPAAKNPAFGIKAGLNIATITGDVNDASPRLGVHFGVTAEFKLSDRFSIQPELLYSMQGVKETVSEEYLGSIITGEGTTKMDYINLPVMAKIYLSDGFSLEVGPQIGVLVSGKISYDLNFEGENVSGTEDASSELKSVDFAFNAGLGYKLPSGLFFQGRYSLGLTNTYDGDFDTEGKNGVLQFSIGYQFK